MARVFAGKMHAYYFDDFRCTREIDDNRLDIGRLQR